MMAVVLKVWRLFAQAAAKLGFALVKGLGKGLAYLAFLLIVLPVLAAYPAVGADDQFQVRVLVCILGAVGMVGAGIYLYWKLRAELEK